MTRKILKETVTHTARLAKRNTTDILPNKTDKRFIELNLKQLLQRQATVPRPAGDGDAGISFTREWTCGLDEVEVARKKNNVLSSLKD